MPLRSVDLERHTPQDAELAAALDAVANPVRLALLRQLRTPKALKEIRVAPAARGGGAEDRPISRQSVRQHLDKLLETGIVLAHEAERAYGTTVEYVVNHQSLFAVAEEFRGLARLRPAAAPAAETMTGVQGPDQAYRIQGPCLVLVKGLEEGSTFDLSPGTGAQRSWTIGRSRGLEVPLDFDPFISTENAVVRLGSGGYTVEDLDRSRNGTTLNFHPLSPGDPRPLENGDLIGVGRSLLAFRA